MEEQIGVILSVYNGENYLNKCIESILEQSFSNFKLYIIDDASTDKSLEIINSFKDSRIQLIRNYNNLGLTKSLNKAIQLVEEKYIARIDADDICMLDRLQIQYEYLERHDEVAIVGSSAISINSFDQVVGEILVPINNLKERLFFKNSFIHSSIMIRTKVIKEYYYDESLKYAQDFNLWSRISHRYKLSNIDVPLLKYRVHNESISFVKKREQLDSVFQTIKYNISLFTKEKRLINILAKMHFDYFFLNSSNMSFYRRLKLIFNYHLIIKLNKNTAVYNNYFESEIIRLIGIEKKILLNQIKKKLWF